MRRASGLLIFVLGLCAWCFKGVDGTELGGAGDGSCGVSRVHAGAAVSLRLRGGTGQGGPSRGFRSKGSSMKWRHPHTLFLRVHSSQAPPSSLPLARDRTSALVHDSPSLSASHIGSDARRVCPDLSRHKTGNQNRGRKRGWQTRRRVARKPRGGSPVRSSG